MATIPCPQCSSLNDAASPACDACGALLGGAGAETMWLVASATITALIAVVTMVLGLTSAASVAALSYGPMIAAWISPRDVVWPAAIGGLVGAVAITVIALLFDGALRPLAAVLIHGVNPVVAVLRVGVALLAIPAAALPFCYVGAAAGGRLAEGRRRELAVIVASVPRGTATAAVAATAAMSDDELAKIRL